MTQETQVREAPRTMLVMETAEALVAKGAPNPPQAVLAPSGSVLVAKKEGGKLIYGCVRSRTSGKINLLLDTTSEELPLSVKEIAAELRVPESRVLDHVRFWHREGRGIGPMLRETADHRLYLVK